MMDGSVSSKWIKQKELKKGIYDPSQANSKEQIWIPAWNQFLDLKGNPCMHVEDYINCHWLTVDSIQPETKTVTLSCLHFRNCSKKWRETLSVEEIGKRVHYARNECRVDAHTNPIAEFEFNY